MYFLHLLATDTKREPLRVRESIAAPIINTRAIDLICGSLPSIRRETHLARRKAFALALTPAHRAETGGVSVGEGASLLLRSVEATGFGKGKLLLGA